MKGQSFSLRPFPPGGPPPIFRITGAVSRRAHTLAICYELHGPLEGLKIPAPADRPVRKAGLWEDTCFEFFLAVKNAPQYWEFNLSPAGHWNIYRFDDYRQGMEEETALASLPFSVQRRADLLGLSLEVNLDKIVRADQALAVAVATVLRLRNGVVTYWALIHPGPEPDFHRQESFVIAL